ncbi:MAG: hypothetical protein ACJ74R_06970, partial [Gaiellaceae bacterium]
MLEHLDARVQERFAVFLFEEVAGVGRVEVAFQDNGGSRRDAERLDEFTDARKPRVVHAPDSAVAALRLHPPKRVIQRRFLEREAA